VIGAFDTRAMLQQAVTTPDGGGGFSQSWSVVATVWIALEAQSGTDAVGPDVLDSRVRYRVTLRRRGDVAAGMRLVTSAHTLTIHDVLDDGTRSQTMILLCEDAP
jgi:SPP1 family predicted phage head-tail adaptor